MDSRTVALVTGPSSGIGRRRLGVKAELHCKMAEPGSAKS
jgi:hypothetical protein